jgi:hypothetical protein
MIGVGATAGIATETVFGTFVPTAQAWCGLKRSSLALSADFKPSEALLPGGAAMTHASQRDRVYLGHDVGGDISIVPMYGGLDFTILLRHAFMGIPVDAGVVGNYTHTYVLGDSFPGFSWQQIDGSSATDANLARRYNGCVIDKWTWGVSARGFADFTATIIAVNEGDPQTVSGTISYPDGEEIVAGQGTPITWNSITMLCTDFSITQSNNLARTPAIGSYVTGKPSRSGFSETIATAKVYVDSSALYVAYKARTTSNLAASFTGTGTNAIAWTVQDCVMTKCTKMLDGAGEIYYQCEWTAKSAALTTGLRCVVTNSNSTWQTV